MQFDQNTRDQEQVEWSCCNEGKLKDTASQASKDPYNWLKGLLKRRIEGSPDAERALAEYESAPVVTEAPLREVLLQTRVYEDEEILNAARKVLPVVKTQQQAIGKYNVQAESVQGLVQGDHAQVEMNFGNLDKPAEN